MQWFIIATLLCLSQVSWSLDLKSTPCHNHLKRALTHKSSGMVGVFVPKCGKDGTYAKIQCHASTGYCWCADKYGKKIIGTSVRGTPSCDKKGCSYKKKFYDEKEARKDDCNTCVCGSAGLWRCTKMACRPKPPLPKGCLHNGKRYKEKETRKDDCNTCFCGSTGHWGCTMMFCLQKVAKGCLHNGKRYKEMETRKDDCNTCFCGSTGQWGCTMMACLPKAEKLVKPKCRVACTRELNYKCGSDGKNYPNGCLMRLATCRSKGKITQKYDGKCRDEKLDDVKKPSKVICKQIQCAMFCLRGFALDSNGCNLCRCRPRAPVSKVICKQIQCAMFCFAGFALDSNGCKLCRCRPRAPAPLGAGAPGSKPNAHLQG